MKRRTKLASKIDETRDIDEKGKVTFGGDVEVDGKITTPNGEIGGAKIVGTDVPNPGEAAPWFVKSANLFFATGHQMDYSKTAHTYEIQGLPSVNVLDFENQLYIRDEYGLYKYSYATGEWDVSGSTSGRNHIVTISQNTHTITLNSTTDNCYIILEVPSASKKVVTSVAALRTLIGNNTVKATGFYKADTNMPSLLEVTADARNLYYIDNTASIASVKLTESALKIADRVRNSAVSVTAS